MTWTILILVLGIAIYLFGGTIVKQKGGKSQDTGSKLLNKSIKVIAIILITGSVCRLWTPYYLTSVNPAILQEMANGMQAQLDAEKNKGVREYVASNAKKMTENAPIMGKEEAAKTIYLFSDYSCGYCRRVHGELVRVLGDRDDVRVVLKNFSIHGPLSDAPAKAVIAAKLQSNEKAAALDVALMTKEYFSNDDMKDQSKLGEKVHKNVMKFAQEVGLDVKRLESDMNGAAVAQEMAQVREMAERFQISGTPFLIIEGKAFPGAIPYSQIIQALN